MPINGFDTSLPSDCLLDTGIVVVGSTIVGATRGGIAFDPGRQTRNIPFDGKRSDIKGLDRTTGWDPVVSFTLLEFASTEISKVEPGVTSATVGSVTTYTPKGAGALYASGDYLADFRLIFERSGGSYAALYFASAICVKWGPMRGQDNNEAEIPVEIRARLVASASSDVPKCPYVIELRSALP